jgi:hypothetical protein
MFELVPPPAEVPAEEPAGQPDWRPALWDLLDLDEVGRIDWSVTLAAVLADGPGPEAGAVLAVAAEARLTDEQQLLLVRAWEAQAAHAQAAAHDALAELAGQPGPDDVVTEVEVASILGVAARTAGRRIEVARALRRRLPLTARRLRSGAVTYAHACAVVDELMNLDDDEAAAVEEYMFGRLTDGAVVTPAQLRTRLRRAVLRVAGDRAADDFASAQENATVTRESTPDGCTAITAVLGAVDGEIVWQALTRQAKQLRDPEQNRPLDYWRGQVLVGWAQADVPSGPMPRRAEVGVVVDLPTLLRLRDEPGDLAGYGPIPAEVARSLAADALWRRWLVDPLDGQLLDLGRTAYRPSKAIRDFVEARDRRCAFPGCVQPSWRCDLDHEVAWADGGDTSADQLQPLCRRHHALKTTKRWIMSRDRAGRQATWVSPLQQRYVVGRQPVLDHPAPGSSRPPVTSGGREPPADDSG